MDEYNTIHMSTQRNEVVNSKAGRTTENRADSRNNISVLKAMGAKYNLPITAFDWLAPIVQTLDTRLSTIKDEDDGETTIMTIRMVPIVYSGSTKSFYPKYSSDNNVALEEAVVLGIDGYDRIDLSYLAARLEETENESKSL